MVNGISHRISRVLSASLRGAGLGAATLALLLAAAPASAAPDGDDDERGRARIGNVFSSGDWRGWDDDDDNSDDDSDDERYRHAGGYKDRGYGSGHGQGPGHSHGGYGKPQVIVHGESCSCGPCGLEREYARGFNRGEAAGANQGFRDGLSGKKFCADVRDDLCRESKVFVDGYMASFSKAYRAAYERGRFERSRTTCKPVYRPRCP